MVAIQVGFPEHLKWRSCLAPSTSVNKFLMLAVEEESLVGYPDAQKKSETNNVLVIEGFKSFSAAQ